MAKQVTRVVSLPLHRDIYLLQCGKCKWKFFILAIIENERECPDVEPITYSYLEQGGTEYCPMCGVKIDEREEG